MDNENISESLYSRQLLTLGKEAMNKITNTNVIICGLKGESIELAKCIILAGVRKVTLYDSENKLSYNDLASNYYVKPDMVDNEFITQLKTELASLNSNVIVDTVNELSDLILMRYHIAVFCDYYLSDLRQYNDICRELNVKFIMIQTHGLSGNIFCDFGDNYIINDGDGEPIRTGIITKIQDNKFYTNEPHGLYMGDIVKFSANNIVGETLYMMKPITGTSFVLREYKSVGQNKSQNELQKEAFRAKQIDVKDIIPENLTFEQVKIPFQMKFTMIDEALNNPNYIMFDMMDWFTYKVQNAFMNAYSLWREQKRNVFNLDLKYYNVFNNDNYKKIKILFNQEYKRINNNEDITEEMYNKFDLMYYSSIGRICGVDAIIGAIGAQEVIKAASNKFTPNNGFLHYTATDILPDNYLEMRTNNPDDYKLQNSRYDGQYAIFGKQFIDRLQDKKLFIVGAGAIGCEHIKNFGMMGIKNITITDMDHIENSNLNRQFLFRPTDIGQPKSIIAAKKGMIMNPDINIIPHENKIGTETLNVYDSKFNANIDIYVNALDNIEARLIVDGQCVKYDKPLLEAGTLGLKGNIQTIVPYLTESYGSLTDPPEQNIPVCTLKLFPYKFEHIVQYSRDLFEGYFNRTPANYIKASNNIETLYDMTPTDIITMYEDISTVINNSKNFKNCIYLAYKEWHKLYRDTIEQLIRKYPANHLDDDGNRFWSGNKIFPTVLTFDTENKTHMDFIITFSNIWADILGITKRYPITKRHKYVNFIKELPVPNEVVCRDIDIDDNKTETKQDTKTYINMIINMIETNKNRLNNVTTMEFEKDDDKNHHIDFITSATNLRATNYSIKTQDRLSVKGIAGKIIPAVITTTSIVSGLVSLEFYKLCYGQEIKEYNTLERYKYGSFNLAIQSFCFGESNPAKTIMYGDDSYSIWTKEEIDANTLFRDFINGFNECNYDVKVNNTVYQLKVDFVSNETGILYSNMMNSFNSDNTIMNKTVGDVIKESLNIDVLNGDYFLTVCLERVLDDNDEDIQEDNDDNYCITCKITV